MVASGNEVGKISIRVVPNLDKFREDLREALEDEERKQLESKVGADTKEYEEGVEKANKKASDTSKVAPGFDGSKYTKEYEKATKNLPTPDPPDTDLKVNLDRFKRRYKSKFQAMIADFESNIPLTADGELIRNSLKGLEDEFDARIALLDPDKDINTLVRLRRQVEKFYRDTRESAPELLGKNVSQQTKQQLKSLSELTKFGADLAAQMVEFDKAVAESKAKSDRIWSDVDYRLRISVDEGEIVKVRRSLSERVVVPVSLQAKFDKGGFTRSAAIAVAGAKELTSVVASPFKILAAAPGIAAKAFARLGPEVVALTGLIAALLPPVLALGAGLITLAPAALAALVPIGAIALGMDGIKKAAETAKPAFDELKAAVSSVFENGLPGQNGMVAGFEAIRDRLIPNITESLKGVAQSITNSFNGVVGVLASPKGLSNLNNIFDNVAAGIENAKGGLKSFTEGILQLVSAISNKFPGLGQWFTDLGNKFSGWVDKFTSVEDSNGLTGLERTIQNVRIGIEGLTGVFQTFFSQGLKDIQSADFGAGMKKFFNSVQSFVTNTLPSLTEGFKQVADLLKQMEPLFDTFGALTNLGKFFVKPGEAVSEAVKRFKETGSLKEAFTGLGAPAEKGGQEAAAGLNKGLETGLEQTKKSIEDSLKPQAGVVKGEFGGGISDDGIGPAITGKVNTAISAAKSTLTAFQGEFAGMIATALEPVNQIPEKLNATFANMGAAFVGAFTALKGIVTTEVAAIGNIIAQGFMTIPAKLTPAIAGFGAAVGAAVGAIKGFVANAGFADAFGQAFSGVAGRVASALSGVPAAVASAMTPAIDVVSQVMLGIVNVVTAVGAQVAAVAAATFAQFPPAVQGAMSPAIEAVGLIGQQMVSTALSFAGAMESAGRSIGASFAAGIASSSGLVAGAASSLMAAARAFIPSSPAEKGPFSGRGWVTYSGESVGEGFAKGMQNSTGDVVSTARELMKSVKEIFGSAEGLQLNFNLGGVTQQAEAATKQVQVFGDTLSKVPTGPLNDLAAASGDGLSSADSKAQRDELSQQLDLLEMERKSLELEKGRAGANNDAIKARLAEIKEQKLQLGLQRDQLDYAKKYGAETEATGGKVDQFYRDMGEKIFKMPTDFARAIGSQFTQDLGISGQGAIPQLLEQGAQYIFQVANMDTALSAQQTLQRRQGMGLVGR